MGDYNVRHKEKTVLPKTHTNNNFSAVLLLISDLFQNGDGNHLPGTQQPLRELARDLKSGNSNKVGVAGRLFKRFICIFQGRQLLHLLISGRGRLSMVL